MHPLSLTFFSKKAASSALKLSACVTFIRPSYCVTGRKVKSNTAPSSTFGQQERLGSVILDIRHEIVVHLAELLTVLIRHACDRLGCVTGRAEGQFTAEQRRKTQKLTEQPAVERLPFFRLRCGGGKSCAGNRERVVLVLCGRHAVKQTGQNLSLAGQVAVYTAQSVNNAVVLAAQDDVECLPISSQMRCFLQGTPISSVVSSSMVSIRSTAGWLTAAIFAPCTCFAQQHAEHRRRRRILSSRVNEMHARRACRNGEQQSARTAPDRRVSAARFHRGPADKPSLHDSLPVRY